MKKKAQHKAVTKAKPAARMPHRKGDTETPAMRKPEKYEKGTENKTRS